MKQTDNKMIFVAHTHWDREWYLSHGRHNYRLIKFMDRLIDILAEDKSFTSFHLDGQVVLLEDYLSVRPERREIVKKLAKEGRLKIGPNYILQDEYLVSGEASIRNLLYGMQLARDFAEPVFCGYFPDAFGNISQVPQIMRGFGIDNAFFGRGIVPMGYANEVIGKADEGFSELIWKGADGSEIIGVQFVNWYNNANEIPEDPDAAVERIKAIGDACRASSRTPYWLALNGCDHQPVQKNLPEILEKVKDRLPFDVEIGSLEEYMADIRPYKDSFYRHEGEICGLNGNGYFSLVHTASSRVYLKQFNHRAQCLLEEEIEPLMSMLSALGGGYDSDLIRFLWKKLLKNHPHDSICGCSCDAVCAKMETRFDDVISSGEDIKEDLCRAISQKIVSANGRKHIVVFNTGIREASPVIELNVDYFEGETVPEKICLRSEGGLVSCTEMHREKRKIYRLPEDRFRQVYDVTTLTVRFEAKALKPLSVTVFSVEEADVAEKCEVAVDPVACSMENELLHLSFQDDGSFCLTDKRNGKIYANVNRFSGQTDAGNEYEFRPQGSPFFASSGAEYEFMPVSGGVGEVVCKIELGGMSLISRVRVKAGSPLVEIKTEIDNVRKDWRLRASADCGSGHEYAIAYGQFDCVRRKIRPGEKWENPCRDQRCDGYVYLDGTDGIAIVSRGLHEYEAVDDPDTDRLYTTLLRAVGEIGDWFYFSAPGAQIQRKICAEYAFLPFIDRTELSDQAEAWARPKTIAFADDARFVDDGAEIAKGKTSDKGNRQSAAISDAGTVLPFGAIRTKGNVQFSALKRAEADDGWILRVFNPSRDSAEFFAEKFTMPVALDEGYERGEKAKSKDGWFPIEPKRILTLKYSDSAALDKK